MENKRGLKVGIVIFIAVILAAVVLAFVLYKPKSKNVDYDNNNQSEGSGMENNNTIINELKIGDAKKISSNPGTLNKFTFEMNGKKYEFNSKDNIYLYDYSQYKKAYEYDDQNGIVDLVINLNNNLLFLNVETDERIKINNISSFGKLVGEKNGFKIYKIDTKSDKEKYDVVWNEFLWTTNIQKLKNNGFSDNTLYEAISNIENTIKETEVSNTLGDPDDIIMKIDVLNEYRYALRETPLSAYSAIFNVNSGNSKMNFGAFSISYYVEYNGTQISIDYENNSESEYGVQNMWKNYEDTGITFANCKVYTYNDSLYNKNYVVMSSDKKSRLHIHPTSYGNMTDDDLNKVLSIALEKKELD